MILPSITIASPALLVNGAGAGSSLGLMEGSPSLLMAILRIACLGGTGYFELGISLMCYRLPLSPLPPRHRLRIRPQSLSCFPCFRLQPFQRHGDNKRGSHFTRTGDGEYQ
jgi:hypothetical protein